MLYNELNCYISYVYFIYLISLHFQRGKLCWYCNKLLLYSVNYSNFVLTNQTTNNIAVIMIDTIIIIIVTYLDL